MDGDSLVVRDSEVELTCKAKVKALENQNVSNKILLDCEKMSVLQAHEVAYHNSAWEHDKETPVLAAVKWQTLIVNTSVSEPRVNDLFRDNIVSAGMNPSVEADADLDAYKAGSPDCCSFVIAKLVPYRPAG